MVHHDSPMCFWMIYHDLPMCCLVNQQNMINHLFGWIIMIYRYFCGIYHDFLGVSWFIYHDFWGTMIYKSVMMYHDLSQFGGCLDIVITDSSPWSEDGPGGQDADLCWAMLGATGMCSRHLFLGGSISSCVGRTMAGWWPNHQPVMEIYSN